MGRAETPAVAEFRRRREHTWRLARGWVAVGLLGFAGALWVMLVEKDSPVFYLAFVLAGAGIVGSSFIVKKHYRCPACEEPLVTSEGVELSPRECPHCGEVLRMDG